jgi:ElaB/YqjD/DUF883 family membrane-anchored ribosome-binding protein
MANQTRLSSLFPASRDDVSQLRQTAMDAASDLGSTAAVHASKAKSHLKDLAGHVQEEGGEQIDQFRGTVSDLVATARDYVTERPLVCIGAALAVGLLIGLSRRRRRESV